MAKKSLCVGRDWDVHDEADSVAVMRICAIDEAGIAGVGIIKHHTARMFCDKR